jgi:hypothetical protein
VIVGSKEIIARNLANPELFDEAQYACMRKTFQDMAAAFKHRKRKTHPSEITEGG